MLHARGCYVGCFFQRRSSCEEEIKEQWNCPPSFGKDWRQAVTAFWNLKCVFLRLYKRLCDGASLLYSLADTDSPSLKQTILCSRAWDLHTVTYSNGARPALVMVKNHKNTIYHHFLADPSGGLVMATLFWQLSVIIVIPAIEITDCRFVRRMMEWIELFLLTRAWCELSQWLPG